VRLSSTTRAIVVCLAVLLTTACADRFQPLPPGPAPDLSGTWTGTWGGQPTTLVIQGQGSEQPQEGLFVGTISVDALLSAQQQATVSGTITHPGPSGPLSSTFTGRVDYVAGQLTLLLNLPTFNEFQEIALAVEGNERLVGAAARDIPEGPRGAIRLVRQAPRK
jgi:hypothetical protein